MNFEWDPRKAAKNRVKHGVSFHEAATVFANPLSITYSDPDHSREEERYLTVGVSRSGRVLIIAHTDRGEDIRVISARKTTPHERKQHEEGCREENER